MLNYKILYLFFILCSKAFLYTQDTSADRQKIYFELPKTEQGQLKERPIGTILIQELSDWDKVVQGLLDKNPLGIGNTQRLYAYLYNAQEAFAKASFDNTGNYSGTLNPISLHVIQLFYPNFQKKEIKVDPYSQTLSDLLIKKIDQRFHEEQSHIRPLSIQPKPDQWQGKQPYIGITVPSMFPWVLTKASEFRLPPPPAPQNDKFWKEQLIVVENSVANITKDQKKEVLFWAGMSGPGSGDWMTIANQYMEKNAIPLSKRLIVRAKLATAESDTIIATYDSKYTYLVKRPFMLDSALKTIISTPNHPSYPAGHSTGSAAAATVLSYYFPENQKNWEEMAKECGLSRIRAGIHFPIDHEAGTKLGKEVANAVLNRT